MNFGLLTILGIIATLGSSRTKELKNDVDKPCKIETIKTQPSTLSDCADRKIKVNNNKSTVAETTKSGDDYKQIKMGKRVAQNLFRATLL